jgi:hypothetical protein
LFRLRKKVFIGIVLFGQMLMSIASPDGFGTIWSVSACRLRVFERVPIGSNHLVVAIPALVTSIHVFLAGASASRAFIAATSLAMTSQRGINVTRIPL